jgi:hypothetical protein
MLFKVAGWSTVATLMVALWYEGGWKAAVSVMVAVFIMEWARSAIGKAWSALCDIRAMLRELRAEAVATNRYLEVLVQRSSARAWRDVSRPSAEAGKETPDRPKL